MTTLSVLDRSEGMPGKNPSTDAHYRDGHDALRDETVLQCCKRCRKLPVYSRRVSDIHVGCNVV